VARVSGRARGPQWAAPRTPSTVQPHEMIWTGLHQNTRRSRRPRGRRAAGCRVPIAAGQSTSSTAQYPVDQWVTGAGDQWSTAEAPPLPAHHSSHLATRRRVGSSERGGTVAHARLGSTSSTRPAASTSPSRAATTERTCSEPRHRQKRGARGHRTSSRPRTNRLRLSQLLVAVRSHVTARVMVGMDLGSQTRPRRAPDPGPGAPRRGTRSRAGSR
jgi:hypothetical protein